MENSSPTPGRGPSFAGGDRVVVADRGAGTVREPDEKDDFYLVDLDGDVDGDAPYRASVAALSAEETPQEPRQEEETVVSEPPSIFEQLGEQYAEVSADRREVMQILPGRFNGNLAIRVRPVDPKKRKKRVRRIAKRGINDEIEANYAASIIAEATEAVLVRMADGEDYIEAQQVPNAGLGEDPVRFDQRLGKVVPKLGEVLTGSETDTGIVRLLFRNIEALESFYLDLDLWLKEAAPSEDDDEDETEGEERPT